MKRIAVPLCLALLAACARTEDASIDPGESNESYSAVERVRIGGDDEQEPALGEWRNALQEDQPALEFGPQGTAPLLSIVCGDRGGLLLQRHGAVASGPAPMMSVTVGGQSRQLPVTAVPGATPMLRASIPAGDALLAQLAEADAPIALRSGDGTPLILPQNPLIGEFARTCAGGGTRPAAERNDAAPEPQENGAAPAQ